MGDPRHPTGRSGADQRDPGWFTHKILKGKLQLRQISGLTAFLIIALITMVVLVLSQSRGGYLAIVLTGLILVILILRRTCPLVGDRLVGGRRDRRCNPGQAVRVGNDPEPSYRQLATWEHRCFSLNTLNGRVEIWSRAIWAIRTSPDRAGDERFPQCYLLALPHLSGVSGVQPGACP